mmetsp:Transcript_49584/g.128642  ORF Transcript_49584/g.128642 Transcript_49584/m.128642 type:complete len:237 (-) Transcript_49584:439-1149(-)
MAACASWASFAARAFSFFPISRISVDSFMCISIFATISLAAVISSASCSVYASDAWILACSSAILSSLSARDASVLLTSRSHQCLCSSSSFCSLIKWNIIFSIIPLTSSKGPPKCADTSWANHSRVFDLASWAALRSSCRALSPAPGPELPTCRKLRGDGGGTGFSGGSVRTPVTSAKILMATSIALTSCSRVFERSAHCASLVLHFCSVSLSSDESAERSACVEARSVSALSLAA